MRTPTHDPTSAAKEPPLFEERFVVGQNDATFQKLAKIIGRFDRLFQVESMLDETQFVLTHPEEVRHVLVSNYQNYRKGRTFRNMKLLMGNGLIVQDGEFWRQQRKMLQPMFHERVLGELADTMRSSAEHLLDAWTASAARGERVNLTADISRLTLDTLLRALFSEDLDAMAAADGINPFHLLTSDPSRDFQFVPKFRALLSHVLDVVERRHQEGRAPHDLLTMLLHARDEAGNAMSPQQLCDEVGTLLVAGHETTATVLGWVWLLLSRHPEVEAKLHQEIDRPTTPSSGALPAELPYVRMVVLEALRLYPPVWIEDREAIDDDVIGGFRIPKGAEIFIPVYFLHRNEKYFEEALTFRPERFASFRLDRRYLSRRSADAAPAGGGADAPVDSDRRGRDRRVNPHPLEYAAYIPFGTGPRRCIGDQFALVNAQIHIQTVGRRLQLRHGGEPVDLEPRVNLRPKVDLQMTPRLRRPGVPA